MPRARFRIEPPKLLVTRQQAAEMVESGPLLDRMESAGWIRQVYGGKQGSKKLYLVESLQAAVLRLEREGEEALEVAS